MSKAATTSHAIQEFALRVREALNDLPAEDIDDLTGGLEADLTEQAADYQEQANERSADRTDGTDRADNTDDADGLVGNPESGALSPLSPQPPLPPLPPFHPGDPAAYAAELRAAAGLPARDDTSKYTAAKSLIGELSKSVTNTASRADSERKRLTQSAVAQFWRLAKLIASHRASRAILEFWSSLKPAWWVLRGWIIYKAFAVLGGGQSNAPIDSSAVHWVALAALVVGSVQWGRGKWMPWPAKRFAPLAATIVAALAFFPIVSSAIAMSSYYADQDSSSYLTDPHGMSSNGNQITNIFAYDENGNQLDNVQLFDQDGNPLITVSSAKEPWTYIFDKDGAERAGIPSPYVQGRSGWNVFPLRLLNPKNSQKVWESEKTFSAEELFKLSQPAPAPFPNAQPLSSSTAPARVPSTAAPTPAPTPGGPAAVDPAPGDPAADDPAPDDPAPANPAPVDPAAPTPTLPE